MRYALLGGKNMQKQYGRGGVFVPVEQEGNLWVWRGKGSPGKMRSLHSLDEEEEILFLVIFSPIYHY
ncbi:hypothetical protein NC652_014904 [Populus alba x Populus x berolinensis]|uniref:Uncharacterized protein n=1 Tax=Populus alba x Populus x berolinensis TaxID=444605 RepID=A0AAD6W4A3_9ROSI|nr:hypothetical protein NC652_014904 [Populus alba x Populus x berolinensis]KAJ6998823.1 hypothetical protein NC653_014853 [Populus alba x Populus x berolinensis]